MPINPNHIAAGSIKGNFSEDIQNCFIHFFAQNLNKKNISKSLYENVYLLYKEKYFNGDNSDNYRRFEDEIRFLSRNNPKELEKRLRPIFTEQFDQYKKKAKGTPFQQLINFFGSMGIECEAYLEPDLETPIDIYTLLRLRRPNSRSNAPKFKVVATGSLVAPRVKGFEYGTTPEDEVNLQQHKDILANPNKAKSLSEMSASGTAVPNGTGSLGNTSLPRVPVSMPSVSSSPVSTSKMRASKPKKNEANGSGVASVTSPMDIISKGVESLGEIFNLSNKTKNGMTSFFVGIFDFFKKIISAIMPVISPLLKLFGSQEQEVNSKETNGSESAEYQNEFEDSQNETPNLMPPILQPKLKDEKFEKDGKHEREKDLAFNPASRDLAERLRLLQEKFNNPASQPKEQVHSETAMPQTPLMLNPLMQPGFRKHNMAQPLAREENNQSKIGGLTRGSG